MISSIRSFLLASVLSSVVVVLLLAMVVNYGLTQKGFRKGPNQAFPVKVDLGRDELDRFLAHQMELPGADVQPVPHRNYRYAGLGGHLIGYMNEVNANDLKALNAQAGADPYNLGDYIGRRGLEWRYERVLRGHDGKER